MLLKSFVGSSHLSIAAISDNKFEGNYDITDEHHSILQSFVTKLLTMGSADEKSPSFPLVGMNEPLTRPPDHRQTWSKELVVVEALGRAALASKRSVCGASR